ncbi:MAG TPA: FlgD immunoglobulin-like domain containing protein [Candidatus Krumholzibacteria bacterium]|nr:FlgD immunoglobulin-like domain containing protein [Candidatus Krumholzibacteria bacterium]
MKRLFLVVAVLAISASIPRTSIVDASADEPLWRCGTELTQSDIDQFKAREQRPRNGFIPQGAPAPPYCIPIAAHIVRTSGGTGGLSLDRLDQGIVDCNTMYQNTGMVFQLLSVDYIDDDDYYYNVNTDAEIDAMIQENVVADAINVYFTPNLSNEDGGLCGRGSFTTSTPQGVAMNNGCTGTSDNPSTFPHELGHFFDLFHTHETAFGDELVDGSNCGSAGDKLCDTPADPGLDEGTNVNSYPSCSYYGGATDGNGDSYNPDTHQLMSYAPKECRDVMSPQSETKVVATLLNERPELLNKGCAPTANAGGDIIAECTGPSLTQVQLDGTGSSDPEGGALTYSWSATGIAFDDDTSSQPTGGFPFGTTTVTLTVSDGNYTRTDEVNVTVDDTTPPDITCPSDITVECESHCGTPATNAAIAAFLADVSATDVCDASLTIENNAPTCFPEGATVVTFTTEDSHGNDISCQATVTVEDTTPPEITVVLDRDALWPPNHKMVEVCVDFIEVTDICDDAPTYVLQEITSDEPENDVGDGNTEPDIQGADFETPDLCFDLRAERQGTENGRTYTIVYRAEDGAGNEAFATVYVEVPHDQSANAMAASGYSPEGTEFIGDRFAVVIPSTDGIDAAAIDPNRVYVGNTRGATRPVASRLVDVNADGREDLALEFPSNEAMSYMPVLMNVDPEAGGLQSIYDGPVGVHFNAGGIDYLVSDIFALGEPVEIPTLGAVAPPLVVTNDVVSTPRETGFKAIHPNPFNPQTTVTFTLASPEHVRIAIYDVRGTLVRRLEDRAMPAGEHSVVWDGRDDGGRTGSSGIYFVRMLAGRTVETRKIVMLK